MVHARFPHIAAACRAAGLDLARDPVPVSPAAHYVMGGVETDLDGRTSVPGLFAAGEVACTGVHGANRLASNSLLEGLVFGRRAGAGDGRDRRRHVAGAASAPRLMPTPAVAGAAAATPSPTVAAVRDADVDPGRPDPRSRRPRRAAVAAFDADWRWLAAQPPRGRRWTQARLASLIMVGGLMARAALRREESRGGHYRSDFPARDDARWGFRMAEQRTP